MLTFYSTTTATAPTGGDTRLGRGLATALRYGLLAALTGMLLYLGLSPATWQATLTRFGEALLPPSALGWLHAHTSSQLTMRSVPGMVLYALSYCGTGGLLAALALGPWAALPRTGRWVASGYALGLGLCLGLLLLGCAGVPAALPLTRRLIDALVSPLPVVVLIALGYSPLRRPATSR